MEAFAAYEQRRGTSQFSSTGLQLNKEIKGGMYGGGRKGGGWEERERERNGDRRKEKEEGGRGVKSSKLEKVRGC